MIYETKKIKTEFKVSVSQVRAAIKARSYFLLQDL